MQNQDNFWAALNNFKPPSPVQIEYRIYYNKTTGEILNYTNEILPGDYIVVDRETFARHRFDCTIKDGKIVPFRPPIGKLVPSSEGTPCHASDISIIASSKTTVQHWKLHTYES